MIFQASDVSTTMAMCQVDFFDSNGESMNMLLLTSPMTSLVHLPVNFRGHSHRVDIDMNGATEWGGRFGVVVPAFAHPSRRGCTRISITSPS